MPNNELVARTGLVSKQNVFVTGSVTATAAVGFVGTASWALNTQTASFFNGTASWATNAVSAQTASFASFFSGSGTGSLFGTASWAINSVSAQSATVATSASWASASLIAQTASFLTPGTYQITSSWAVNSITASSLLGFNFTNTSSYTTQSSVVVIQVSTGSDPGYIAAWFDYAAFSGSSIRSGTVFTAWLSGSLTYSEYTNVDVGDTSVVTMSAVIASGFVQLLFQTQTQFSWSVRALARYV